MITMHNEPVKSCSVVTISDKNDENQEIEEYIKKPNTKNKFCVDYSKRGTAKCKICSICITKNELRIGTFAFFKGISITNFSHVNCFFNKMKRARVEVNVIKAPSELDGFEEISKSDKEIIENTIEEDNRERKHHLLMHM